MGVAPGMVYSTVLQKMYTKKHYGDVEATDRVPSVAEYLTRHSTRDPTPARRVALIKITTSNPHTP
jgi:hypothetical protein